MENKKLKPIVQIIMTPIVDVVMIMLLFFMIAYSRSSPRFYTQRVEIPDSSTSIQTKKDKESIEVTVGEKGEILVHNRRVTITTLRTILSESSKKGIKKVVIRGDKNAPYQRIIMVIDHVKQARIPRVLLLTKKKDIPIKNE